MNIIQFIDDVTGEEVEFAVLSAIQYKEEGYILVIESKEVDLDESTAYILKATSIDGEDVIYELVDDDAILDIVFPMLEDNMDDFEN